MKIIEHIKMLIKASLYKGISYTWELPSFYKEKPKSNAKNPAFCSYEDAKKLQGDCTQTCEYNKDINQ